MTSMITVIAHSLLFMGRPLVRICLGRKPQVMSTIYYRVSTDKSRKAFVSLGETLKIAVEKGL